MHPLKIFACVLGALASIVWITPGAYMIANPKKAETKKSIHMLFMIGILLASLSVVLSLWL